MDFSIFLYHSYIKEKQTSKDIYEAMEKAITSTISSVVGSSITTIAGFLALCTMQLAIGRDIGLVMAKGVLIGLICVVTVLPATILVFDKLIEKTSHKVILPEFTHLIDFVVKHYKAAIIVFLILLVPAIYGNSHVNVYYNINSSLPESLASVPANKALADDFNMVSTQIALVNKDMSDSKVKAMLDEIDSLDGVEWSIAKAKITNGLVPDEMIDDDIKSIFESDKYQMIVINSSYETATNEENELVNKINDVIKKYDEDGILAGEAPLMKDLVEIADQDFNSVNISSIAVIFILMIFVFKSGSIPFILIAVIEFAIFVNMSCTCYANVTIPFVASIVIGTIQLGATVDYAILMTNKYLDARCDGKNKQESAKYALENDRDVFAVPRNITDTNSLGTNKIIQQGAKLINGAADIISEYPYAEKVIPKKVKSEPIQKTVDDSKYSKLNEFEKQIIDILKKSDMQIDELSRELKRNVSEINTKLIMLEVKGLVKKLPGSKYQLKL